MIFRPHHHNRFIRFIRQIAWPFICLALLLWLPASANGQDIQGGNISHTIITAEEIRTSGITRLHELFTLLDNWSGMSINGQDWTAAAHGLSVYEDAGWVVMVDNQPVNLSIMGWQSFNQLPVSLQEIEKVIVIDTPQLYRGVFTGRGLIHIITDSDDEGWRADLRMTAGNEINDPGPYEFTGYTSPNEERIGPDGDLVLGYRSAGWHIQASGSILRHRSTDTPIERRIKGMLFTGQIIEEPTNLKTAGHLRAGYQAGNLIVNIQGGITNYRDFLFFRPWGREIPVRFDNRYAGMDVIYSLHEELSLFARTAADLRVPGHTPNYLEFDFNFRQAEQSHQAGWHWSPGSRTISGGAELTLSNANGAFSAPAENRIWSFHTQWQEELTAQLGITTDVIMATDGSRGARTAALRVAWDFASGQSLQPYISYSERLPSEARDPWHWIGLGYEGLAPLGLTVQPMPDRQVSALNAAGVHWLWEPTDRFNMTLHGFINRHSSYFLSRQEYTLIQPQQWLDPHSTRFYPSESATIYGLHTSIRFSFIEGLSHVAGLAVNGVSRETAEMRRALDEMPSRQMRLATRYEPVPGFRLWTTLRLHSAAAWHEFEGVDGESYYDQAALARGTYSSRTGPVTHLDFGSSKSMWDERLWLSLIVRNVLNLPYFHYPVGADQDLAFHVQLEMRL